MSAAKLASLAPELRRRVTALIDAAPGLITVFSGRRSPERQRELWAEALAKYGSPAAARKWVAPPGSSKHETGEAADLQYGSGMRQWAHANAARFGLVFRLSNEPWHIERTAGPWTPLVSGRVTSAPPPDREDDDVESIGPGSSQAAVTLLQRCLKKEAIASGRTGPARDLADDGDYGAKTTEAVRQYQAGRVKTSQPGIAGGVTCALLFRYES